MAQSSELRAQGLDLAKITKINSGFSQNYYLWIANFYTPFYVGPWHPLMKLLIRNEKREGRNR